ncbi:hypothetical protein E4U54_004729 [Claviceps lovelessii]|nr:hypothetical protein E4U54_004729 [Claviceps lovelessii]
MQSIAEKAEAEVKAIDPSKSGHFAFLTYFFTLPSVNLDHTDHITVKYHDQDGIIAKFKNQAAFDHAVKSWSTREGLILIAHVPGCEGFTRGERCYFNVTDLQFKPHELSAVARGSSKHPDEITTSGETQWGWWDARQGDKASVMTRRSSSSSEDATGRVAKSPDGLTQQLDCVAPPDAGHGLPTACLDASFDQILDNKLGHGTLSGESTQYLEELMSGTFGGFKLADESARSSSSSTASSRKRATRSLSSLAERSLWPGVDKFFKRAIHAIFDARHNIQSIGGSITREITFKLPGDLAPDSPAWNLLDGVVQAQSPWGSALLLRTLHPSNGSNPVDLSDHLSVYCVDCSVSGHARVAGRARWTARGGLQEGHIELITDLQMVLKLGLEGTANVEKEFSIDFLSFGLPAISYGVVNVGPYFTLGARVGLSAESKGNLLAGAEMGLQGARVVMDLAGSKAVDKSGWGTPYVKPILEATGNVEVSAELGLPFGLKCGIKISSWEEAVGVVEEPSIKGAIHGSVSGALNFNGTGFANVTGGLDEECSGLTSELSWRNRLWAGDIHPESDPVLDTEDQVLFSKCFE